MCKNVAMNVKDVFAHVGKSSDAFESKRAESGSVDLSYCLRKALTTGMGNMQE